MLQDDFDEHAAVLAASLEGALPTLEQAVAATVTCLEGGQKVLVAGNGGSAAQAQHFAAELIGRFEADRPACAAIALSPDAAVVTAIANDEGFERVFARQVEGLARAGDLFVAISTSGCSANVISAAKAAQAAGCSVVALTGHGGGDLGDHADLRLEVASTRVARIQEVHAIYLHAWAGAVERLLARAASDRAGA